jgi:flagellar protein FlaF
MPYRSAIDSYEQTRTKGGNPRETEGRALLEAARRMSEAQNAPEDATALRSAARLNWRLWTIFQAELSQPDCQVPVDLRSNMLNLCNFVDKRVVEVLANPKPDLLDALISINRQIAAGLLTAPGAESAAGSESGAGAPPAGSQAFTT